MDLTVAGRFCLSHASQYASPLSQHSQQQQDWQEPQTLDHRSQSFPVDLRGASHLSVDTADWAAQETAQPPKASQAAQQQSHCRPPVHSNSASQLHQSPKSAWRQSLQQLEQEGTTASFDSGISEMSTGKKQQTVLVWDLDETLILFHSLLSGAYASHHTPEVSTQSLHLPASQVPC